MNINTQWLEVKLSHTVNNQKCDKDIYETTVSKLFKQKQQHFELFCNIFFSSHIPTAYCCHPSLFESEQ